VSALLHAPEQAGLDALKGFAALCMLCLLLAVVGYLWHLWDERKRCRWQAVCDAHRSVVPPTDFAGEIHAYRVARDIEDARGRTVQ
jgi:hypothetical protein